MGNFAPSVEAAKKALGSAVPIETKVHPPGAEGVKFSMDEVARRVAKGRNDPRVRAWAIRAIHAAGGPQDVVEQAQAILTAFKKAAVYVQDPLNTEFIQSAAETLCLDDKGLCFRGGDCDDSVVAYASATLSIGIQTNVVGQAFNNRPTPQHVIAAIMDPKTKQWLRVDPSTDKPVGEFVAATKEWWVDPLDPNDKATASITGSGDFVGVGKLGGRQGSTGVGDTPAAPALADAASQQVQSALYGLSKNANDLAAALDQLAQLKAAVGYDPEPTTFTINGLSDFPPGGVWTKSMDKVARDYLSQADFLVQVGNDAMNGVRTIFVDPTTNNIGIGSIADDPYKWSVVLETATDAIIGIFNPAGALLVGLTMQLGEVLSPSQVAAQTASPPSGTIQGLPEDQQGLGNPAVIAASLAAAAIVATIAVYLAYTKYLAACLSAAQEATMQAMVAYCSQQVAAGNTTSAQCQTWLAEQRRLTNEAQKNNNTDNPFNQGVDKVTSLIEWVVIGAAVVGVGVLAWPLLAEGSRSAAEVLRARRLTRKPA